MALQGSYATWMLQNYEAGKIFSGRSESDFLRVSAKQMNLSVEQLRNAYVRVDLDDFKS